MLSIMASTSPRPTSFFRRRLRRFAWAFLTLVLAVLLLSALTYWYFHPAIAKQERIPYTKRDGIELTFDLIQPENPNGKAILVMNSGSWKSNRDHFRSWLVAPLLRSGFSVFAISHVSQPRVTIMDTVDDVQRATRYIRHHAEEYGVDPDYFGVTGGSSGGHISLCLATLGDPGDPGDPTAPDPIDRESSAIQAVATFFPVTDLLNLGDSTQNPGDGGPPKSDVKGFGPDSTDLEKWKVIGRRISPIFHVKPDLAPILIYHGDADTLVSLDQGTRFKTAAEAVGAGPVEIVVREGKGHGWVGAIFDIQHFVRWFEEHLSAEE